MTYFKNFYFYIFLFFFVFIAGIASINTGITHDELFDYKVWLTNKDLILNFLFNENFDTSYLADAGKYYGIGFHYYSSLLEPFFSRLPQLSDYDINTKKILSKHISVFSLFVISGLIFKRIVKLIINDNHFANLSTIFYLSYPYLLGHSFFNVKDIPFLTLWLTCTYFIIRLSRNYFLKDLILKKHLIFLVLSTSYLLSIRISGVLIFIQYLIFILTVTHLKNISVFNFIKINIKELSFSFVGIFFFYILLQPSYWSNPLLIFDAIKYMSQHIQTVCTVTLGECMKAQNLPASYLPIWFFFKMPIIILLGLSLFIILEKKIEEKPLLKIILLPLAYSIPAIIILLILFNVNLYDEIRQVMFLVPLIFIISLSLIYLFSKKIFSFSVIFFIIFFIIQNIKIFPYNYIWINNFSHITKVTNIFELDYWGASTKKISNFIQNKNVNDNSCIISNRNDAMNSLITTNKCLIDFNQLHKKVQRPFYVALMERGINKGVPNNCKIIFNEQINLNFSNETLTLAKVFRCDKF